MPEYDFKCQACGHAFSEVLSVSSRNRPTKKPCPNCQEKKVEKLFANVSCATDMAMRGKVPGGFREVMSKIKSKHPHHTIHDY